MPQTKLPKFGILLALAALYALGHLLWYLDTPLGKNPVLDGQENLILAQQIEDGSLVREPFYRAMLYPALLSILPFGHSLLGLLCHLANSYLCFAIARRFWNEERAGLLAAALIGFNPVLLHFAFDPLDTTLSITLFLSALALLQKAFQPRIYPFEQGCLLVATGLLVSLATLARPHYLLCLVAIAALLTFKINKRKFPLARYALFGIASLAPLLAYGLVQKSWSGSFQILPWQGAYNLWVSNSPQANGLYYQQTVSFHHLEQHQNPNRMEAALLFEQANGYPGSPSEQSAFWRAKTIKSLLSHPIGWLKLETFKLYAILNNFEQYNNKTYSFHKSLSPWLRYNPIGWGLLLAAATFSCTFFWRQKRQDLIPVFIISASIAAGLLLYMASSRFRLPLVPLLAVLASGLPLAWAAFGVSSKKLRQRALIAAAVALALAFTRFSGIASERTYVQDALLLADAAARSGDDATTQKWAENALERDPTQQQALRLRLIARYNQIASGAAPASPETWTQLLAESESLQLEDELLCYIDGVVLWNNGRKEDALSAWQSGFSQFGTRATSCLAAISLTGHPIPLETLPDTLTASLANGEHRLLAFALAATAPPEQHRDLLAQFALSPEAFASIAQSLQRVLPLD